MRLLPYSDQVTGHACLLTTEDGSTICKAMSRNELEFYLNMDGSLRPYTPEFQGVVDVTVFGEEDGRYEFEAHFRDGTANGYVAIYNFSPKRPIPALSDVCCGPSRKPVKYRGLDPKKFHEIPGFHCNQYTKDVKSQQSFVSDVGRNPWVQRVQTMGVHKNHMGNTIPYILLENLGGLFRKPCILDLKIGTRIHGWDSPLAKVQSHMQKSKMTTTSSIGLRLTGLQVFQGGVYVCRDKFYGRGLSKFGLKEAIKMFFLSEDKLRADILDEVLSKVSRIKSVVSELHGYRLYGCSMVIFYEGDRAMPEEDFCNDSNNNIMSEARAQTDVRVVDFAHSCVTPPCDDGGTQVPDGGFLLGLENLLKMLTEIGKEERS